MPDETVLSGLLSLWEREKALGRDVSAADLCRDHPELLTEVEGHIALLRRKDQLKEGENTPTIPPTVGPSADPYATLPPVPTPSELGAAASVAGYEVLGVLGQGGMGIVYKARQAKLGRIVALKMILGGAHATSARLARFRGEAEAIARLQHPNIVQIYDFGESDGLPYFSLEFVEGGSLDRKLAGTPLPPKDAAVLVETVARAVAAAHAVGLVHRDLKPANVLLAADGTPKVADFGLAKRLDAAGATATGEILGTPSYMAPEQAGGQSKQVGPACDVYALGAILYECLTGRPPFKAATSWDTILQVVSQEPVPPRQMNASIPADLQTICLKCLQKEPERRYASAQELADDLGRFLAGEPIKGRRPSLAARSWKWLKRHPTASVVAGFAILQPVLFRMSLSVDREQMPSLSQMMSGEVGLVILLTAVAIALAVLVLFLITRHVLNAPTTHQGVKRGLLVLALLIVDPLAQKYYFPLLFYLQGAPLPYAAELFRGIAYVVIAAGWGLEVGAWSALLVGVPTKLLHRRFQGSFAATLIGGVVSLLAAGGGYFLLIIWFIASENESLLRDSWVRWLIPPVTMLIYFPVITTMGTLSGALLSKAWRRAISRKGPEMVSEAVKT